MLAVTQSSEERQTVQEAEEYIKAIVRQPDPFPLEFSVLFLKPAGSDESTPEPAYFGDLNLDLLVDAITAEYAEYDLKPFYYRCLPDRPSIVYRQEVMRDLESLEAVRAAKLFAKEMREVRQALTLASNLRNRQHIQAWKAKAIKAYCDATRTLNRNLASCSLKSPGLTAFLRYLNAYVEATDFLNLAKDVDDDLLP